jgi:hypothetical protein
MNYSHKYLNKNLILKIKFVIKIILNNAIFKIVKVISKIF